MRSTKKPEKRQADTLNELSDNSRIDEVGNPVGINPAVLNHAGLKALAKKHRRPLYTLTVTGSDPFIADVPFRRAGAKWFVKLWRRLGIKPGAHLHRIHYVIVSQDKPVLMPPVKGVSAEYENTEECEAVLERASLDARYLGLISPDNLVDRRNPDPIINANMEEAAAAIGTVGGVLSYQPPPLVVPRLNVWAPTIPQRYLLEIWVEKTTVDDVVLPLAQRYGCNVIRGAGELSLTRCVEFARRSVADGCRPVIVILYVSDFDPAGRSMPTAVSRKIEHQLYTRGLKDLVDIQVRPVVLTPEQCQQYRLPRTPLKDSERRAAKFEARFGEGATELDALEALYPGELEKILEREILRYYDAGLDARIGAAVAGVQTDLNTINSQVRRRHTKAIARLKTARRKIVTKVTAFEKKAEAVMRKIERDLNAASPSVGGYDWPEPAVGNVDADPLFDSKRDYLTQIARYKKHQGKNLTRVATPRSKSAMFTMTCPACGEDFETNRKHTQFCQRQACRYERQKARERARKLAQPPTDQPEPNTNPAVRNSRTSPPPKEGN